jgi:serine/threonine protein phosphatase PrpC
MASDGVWDNLYDKDLISLIEKNLKSNNLILENPQKIADIIAQEAEDLGNSKEYESPFSKEAKKHYKGFPSQGKPDDVTVIVA